MKKSFLKFKTIFLLHIFILPVFSDAVLLKTKPTLRGKILTITDETISIETETGIITEPRSNILKLLFEDVSKEAEDKIRALQ